MNSMLEPIVFKPNTYDIQRETCRLMGWQYRYVLGKFCIYKPAEPSTMVHEWEPHKNLADALLIAQKFGIRMYWNGEKWVAYTDYTMHGLIQYEDESLPMAICCSLLEHQAMGRK